MKKLYLFLLALTCSVGMWGTNYTLVTSTSDLVNDANYLLVGATSDNYYVLGGQNSTSNRKALQTTVSNGVITITDPATSSTDTDKPHIIKLKSSSVANKWNFYDTAESMYLNGGYGKTNGAKSNNNTLKVSDNVLTPAAGANGQDGHFSITINASTKAVTCTNQNGWTIWMNTANSVMMFATYETGDYNAVYLYKEVQSGDDSGDDDAPSISAEDVLELTAEEGDGTFDVTWTGMEDVDVNLYTDEACTSAFEGSWFQVDLDGENNVEYLVAENTSTTPRTVYMQLYGIDEELNDYTHVVTVTQAGVIVKYDVLIDDEIENGEISASVATAEAGEEVTLTATPDEGYKLDSWIVTDSENQPVTVTNNKFVMPEGDVLVSATFVETTDIVVTYNFNDKNNFPSGFPTSGTTTAAAQVFNIGGNDIIINATNGYYNINSTTENCGLFFGKTKNNSNIPQIGTSYLGFPAKAGYKLTKVVATSTSGIAGGLPLNVYSTSLVAVSTADNTEFGTKKVHTFLINNSQVNTEYWLTAGGTSGKNLQFDNIVLTYEKVDPREGAFTLANINGTGWGTYYTDFAFVMPENVEGQIMKEEDGSITNITTYEAGDVVPAETALLLKGTAGTYDLVETTTAPTTEATGNLLKGLLEEGTTTGGNVYYLLANGQNGLGWYYGATNGAAFTTAAHKAYLALSSSSAPARILLNMNDTDTATSIDNIESEKAVKFFENGQVIILREGIRYNALGQIVK